MKESNSPGAKRFRSIVATFLGLPADSGSGSVRRELRKKGSRYVEWYETRLRAIEEFEGGTDASGFGDRALEMIENPSQHSVKSRSLRALN